MSDDGTATGANPGTGTPPEPKAGAKFTDDDMLQARKSFAADAERKQARAIEANTQSVKQSILDELDLDSFDDLKAITEKHRSNQSQESEAVTAAKKAARAQTQAEKDRDAAIAERDRLIAQRNTAAVKDAVFAAAKKADAHEEDVYARLVIQNKLDVDDKGAVFVRDANGEPEHGQTVEKLVNALVAANEHLRKPKGTTGAGSLPAGTAAPTGPNYADPRSKDVTDAVAAWRKERGLG
jgi:hypothetical protein